MDPNSPFAKDIPIIGQPKILNVVAVALLQCNCEAKTQIMGPVGPQPFGCPTCRKLWVVQAQVQLSVAQIVNPVDSVDTMQ